jgi:hypothetical protein
MRPRRGRPNRRPRRGQIQESMIQVAQRSEHSGRKCDSCAQLPTIASCMTAS